MLSFIPPVASSANITEVHYLPSLKQLFITFSNGDRWQYFQIPQAAYENFKNDISAGKFYHQVIKKNYTGKKMEGDKPREAESKITPEDTGSEGAEL